MKFKNMADYAQSRMFKSAQEQEEGDRVEAEYAFVDDVITTLCGGACSDLSDFAFPRAYFVENFSGHPKEKWPEIWQATKHLGISKRYKDRDIGSIIRIGEITDALPIEID